MVNKSTKIFLVVYDHIEQKNEMAAKKFVE